MGKLRALGLAGIILGTGVLGSCWTIAAVGSRPAAPAITPVAAVAAAPAPAALASGAPCVAAARACVRLSSNQAWLIQNGAVVYGPTPIRHGRPGWRTPPGTFHVTFKERMHYSTLFNNAPMPYSVFFNGGIAFHEGSLIQSHGCVRMTRAAAIAFFNALQPGDVVQVVP